jgi:hypothetical protein
VLGAAGDVVPGSAAGAEDDGGVDDDGVDDGGVDDDGVEDGGVDDDGVEDGGVDDGGVDDGGVDDDGVEDGGVDDGGFEDGGFEDVEDVEDDGADGCDASPDGDPEPPGCPGKELIGTGGIDVLGPARAGVKNAFGETRTAAGGADEDPARELGAGLDDTEAGEVATAPAPACGWRWLDAGV